MRRVDRLFQIIQHMRRKQVVTAAELAAMLGVSERTIYRDIDHLSVSGVPIMSERGVGFRMRAGYDLPPLMFERDELKALWLGARMVRAWTDPEIAAAAERAIARVEAVLSASQRHELEDWSVFAPEVFAPPQLSARFAVLRDAIERRRKVSMTYTRLSDDETTARTIRPLGIFYMGGRWVVGAWCELRGELRSFRLTRIESCQVLDAPFEPDTPTVAEFVQHQQTRSPLRSTRSDDPN